MARDVSSGSAAILATFGVECAVLVVMDEAVVVGAIETTRSKRINDTIPTSNRKENVDCILLLTVVIISSDYKQ